MNRRERQPWETARDLDDLGDLMATWLEGDLRARPGYRGSTDLDSPELTALCAALCRAGVVTHQSQEAGIEEGEGWFDQARTFLEAFADDEALAWLTNACDGTGLILVARRTPPRRWSGRGRDSVVIPVVERNGRTVLTLDPPIDRSYVGVIWEEVNAQAFESVLDAWQVNIVDPEWGRNELLHEVLIERFLRPRGVAA